MTLRFVMTVLLLATTVGSSQAGQERSYAAKAAFKYANPCPANGSTKGPCPGYVIDHVEPLACGGPDTPANMQWQTTADSKAKDKWERADCGGFMDVRGHRSSSGITKRRNSTGRRHSSGSAGSGAGTASTPSGSGNYHLGPRGGCYTLSGSGKKQYVDHSYCS
ncbi:hypothetical protein [Methylomonas sp. 11b]|uniref:hypothetical protein n=1 Tax=Methylomonas sp. 11b TaxID=1168169 RepID=UPI00047B8D21|nr:hypothetical protein [Methylomonas sp. 11b]